MEIPKLDLNFLTKTQEPTEFINDSSFKKTKKRQFLDFKATSGLHIPDQPLKLASSNNTTKEAHHRHMPKDFCKIDTLSTEFAESINDFIKGNSLESHPDLNKMNNLLKDPASRSITLSRTYKKPPPYQDSSKSSESKKLSNINSMLEKLGYNYIEEGDYDKMAEVLADVLGGYSKLSKPFTTKNQSKDLIVSTDRPWSRSISPIGRKDEDLKFPIPTDPIEIWDSAKLINEEKIFGSFLKRKFDPESESDVKIMGIIVFYEEQMKVYQKIMRNREDIMINDSNEEAWKEKIKGLEEKIEILKENNGKLINEINNLEKGSEEEGITQKICEIFSCKCEDLISIAEGCQEIFEKYNKINAVVADIYSEFHEKSAPDDVILALKEILEKIFDLKTQISQKNIFKSQIIKTLEIKKTATDSEIIQSCKSLPYFKQLFDVEGDVMKEIDSLFLIIKNFQSFAQFIRRGFDLSQDTSITEVLNILREKLYNQ
ncbi:unnamed protein product [Blepharisma stoltei]|uniref:Uncharacterized protein n=1 Tax=Blepharisma stoltei TaxID=1481888 RepID=A0AAU9INZ0_9CILI|nr:unnamed protein product [Blepharisma stoltei]